jgi:hypothetical protein
MSRTVEIVSPAPGFDAVTAWLLAFHSIQFTPGFDGLTTKVSLQRLPFILSNSLEVFAGLKDGVKRAFGATEPALFLALGAAGFVLALLLR